MTVEAGDGLILKGSLTQLDLTDGSDYPLAVPAHQYAATSDSYAPLIEDLLELGVAVLAFDERGLGASTATPNGALVIDAPIDTSGLMLVGSSVGGTAVTLAAPKAPGLEALLTFGPACERVWGEDGRPQGRRAMERITAHTLHVSSEGDAFDGAATARTRGEGLAHARLHLVPDSGHAMAIYYDLRAEVLAFVHRSVGR
jgi:pimeloyl-ACP methyl ester carboxylesterase